MIPTRHRQGIAHPALTPMRFLLLCLLPLLTHLGAETLPPLKDGKVPQNLDELWAGFDPRKEPLDRKSVV